MLLFAHIGITIGIFFIIGLLVPSLKPDIKYRYVALGSLLPDIIDKPIGRFILADSIANGRIFAHTLIFLLILVMFSLYIYRTKKDKNMLIISGASFFHLIEDQMWKHTDTLFWPLFGWDFPYSPSYGVGFSYLLQMLGKSFTLDFSNLLNADVIGIFIIGLVLLSNLRKNE